MTNKFTENGFNDTQARVLADSINDLRDKSVTKDHFDAELARVNSDLGKIKAGFSEEIREIKLMHSVDNIALQRELMAFRVEVAEEFSAMREKQAEFRAEFKSGMSELYLKLSNELIKFRKAVITWLVGAVGVFGAIVFTIDKWLGA